MGCTIIIAEKTATVLRMVEVALKGLSPEIQAVDHGEAALRALRAGPADLLIVRDTLADMSGYEVVAQMRDESALSHIPVLFLLDRNGTLNQDRVGGFEQVDAINLPFKTQTLVERVCTALDRVVPDEALYAPYLLEIPLAQTTTPDSPAALVTSSVVAHEEQPADSEQPMDQMKTSEVAIEAEVLDIQTAPPVEAEVDPTDDAFGEASTRHDLEMDTADAYASTEVFTVNRSGFETQELAESELLSVIDDGTLGQLTTEDDLGSIKEDDVITNAIRPEPPVAPMPDLEELVDRVRDGITEGAGFKGALGDVSRGIIEEIAWEVVPALAEAILKEEIARMIREER